MTRRSFFSLLAAPVVAPMVPETPKPLKFTYVDTRGISVSAFKGMTISNCTVYPTTYEAGQIGIKLRKNAVRELIDEINKEVKRGAVTLTATEVKR